MLYVFEKEEKHQALHIRTEKRISWQRQAQVTFSKTAHQLGHPW